MKLVIVKYNAGNIHSVKLAFKRLGIEARVSDDPAEIRAADKVVFPGQGEAASAMRYLRERNLDKLLGDLTQPFLGICLGLQLMCRHSEEGNTDMLNLFPADVKKFPSGLKIPHMGWNSVANVSGRLFDGLGDGSYFYFVHSYYAELHDDCIARCAYGLTFSAALQHKNYYAVQFHPEKSAANGEKLLRNFLEL